ncbi:hypothetical protein VSH64_07350 [Amycolatopsis rhabdoformis]|uniref:Uncharacterized protein n=1 Tax=Amycolatopsis rhabdoformis TaxID=1448059 RepID=A0ABZ1IEF9_9PSEU|nr:hypothetical protein [Amycolatopsis rhabdoformis]WSE31924.1 hypothetical protein VSH64_07350 [Amycolatopsis rhabdoformis]
MFRKQAMFLAAFVAAGAAVLSACGAGSNGAATAPTGADNLRGAAAASAGALTATSAILFDDAAFSDNGASQGISGKGCQPVARPQVTSSLTATGTLKLWSGKNCTGKSIVVNGNVSNLAKLGFDNKVVSVKLAGADDNGGNNNGGVDNGGGKGNNGGNNGNNNGGDVTLTTTFALLDSGKNLSEPDGSQVASMPGCNDIRTPELVRSIDADGTYKIWTGPQCSGRSMVITGDTPDLEKIGFDRQVASIGLAG